jgi:hypothetical protein
MVRAEGRAFLTGTVAGEVSKVIMPYSTPAAGGKSAVFRAGYFLDRIVILIAPRREKDP